MVIERDVETGPPDAAEPLPCLLETKLRAKG